MNKKIRNSIIWAILGVAVLALGIWGRYSASANAIKEYSENLFQGAWIAIIVGLLLILLSMIMFVLAANSSDK